MSRSVRLKFICRKNPLLPLKKNLYKTMYIFGHATCGLWDLSSLTRDQTQALSSESVDRVLTTGLPESSPLTNTFVKLQQNLIA